MRKTSSSTSYRGRCAEHVNCINYSNMLQYSNVEPSPFFSTCIRNDAVTLPRVGTLSRAITSVELIKLQQRHFPASRKASFRSRASLVIIITIAAFLPYIHRQSDRSEIPSIPDRHSRTEPRKKRTTNRVSYTKIDLSKWKISGVHVHLIQSRGMMEEKEEREKEGENGRETG